MKIYVDEMPKSCDVCSLCQQGNIKLKKNGRYIEAKCCVLGNYYKYQKTDDEIDTCPLNLLATCPQLAEKDKEIKKLEEQLKNAIVPEFEIGDKVYGIIDTWAYTDVFPVEIRDTHLLYEVWDGEDTTKQHSTRIFATKEEAEQKLNELKGNESGE